MKVSSRARAIVGILVVSILRIFSHNAQADLVNGDIFFRGGSGSVASSGGVTTVVFASPLLVDLKLGDYAGIPTGFATSFADITWTGSGTSAILTSNNGPEWTINVAGSTYQYSILSLSAATFVSGIGVSLQGSGAATISGAINRDPTLINFSLQGLVDAQGNIAQFEFSMLQTCTIGPCGPVPAPTPESGSGIALLTVALAAVAGLRGKFLSSSCRA